MTPELFAEIVADAALSPNVHNIQPSCWRQISADTVALLQAEDRTLPHGDPTGRDVAASHGATAEGFILAASLRGLEMTVRPGAPGEVVRIEAIGSCPPDPLAPSLTSRRTYRGKFTPDPATEALAVLADRAPDLRIIAGREPIAWIASQNDIASLEGFRDRPFRAELLAWMRLSQSHPGWSRDGLNARAMEMSPFEAFTAGMVLKPGVFELLDRLGFAAMLTGEAEVVRSSAAVVLLSAPLDEAPFDTGRRWHRMWLEITSLGLAGAPMTVLADNPEAAAAMAAKFGLAPDERLVTAMRIGVPPTDGLPPAARLPLDELIR